MERTHIKDLVGKTIEGVTRSTTHPGYLILMVGSGSLEVHVLEDDLFDRQGNRFDTTDV